MKNFFYSLPFLPLFLVGLGVAPSAQAGLSARPYGMVYDSGLDLTWLQDANYAATQFINSNGTQGSDGGGMDWSAANAWANSLVFAGNTGWRLPTADGSCDYATNCNTSELGHLFYVSLGGTRDTPITDSHNASFNLFLNLQSTGYWTQTAFATDPSNNAWNFDFFDGTQLPYDKNVHFLGWAVHAGDVIAIPEPGPLLLALAGMLGWIAVAGIRTRRDRLRHLDRRFAGNTAGAGYSRLLFHAATSRRTPTL